MLFDYVDSGNSDLSAYSTERYGNFSGYVQDLLDVIGLLQLSDIIFIGHSVSSMIGALAEAAVPTLILQCSDDSIVPVEVGEYLHKHLKNSEFRLMQAKGHYPYISHPEETIALIQGYL
ncbi:pimeloyl-ACP methyl ester carboxylesterase [Paenibacillus sp. PastF-1]|nr:pimeloyl-ACP methyl ester carboxylesterase [Paenibacillus sp. PastF-2]MDF9846454.1 pimeloyl-ACP methyl ester carboxylesterase [Paenibacillus sp. PastM-2]MDF9853197.1 pimeloyl-ACP methyl ester carboxylesterase [Paenibacillus sp. PastF-1]MDH6478299.1 pimeloyl-ACP methyl ester carboxylesterase [Paenibacillus sp. PastH-2]MDH6506203.1 pimeloyl-ACP methyl ester carboxylesterase [Paenibacillus sp. PastM-3]